MSEYRHPTDADLFNVRAQRGKKGKKKGSLPRPIACFFGNDNPYGTEEQRQQLDDLIALKEDFDYDDFFKDCKAYQKKLHPVIQEVNVVNNSGGAPAYLQVRYRDDNKPKTFFYCINCQDDHHLDERTGEHFRCFTDQWGCLIKPGYDGIEPNLYLPLGADRLRAACDKHGPNSVMLVLCEGAHSMIGVQRHLDDPGAAELVESAKREFGVKEIVVCAWIGGEHGAKATNFNLRPHQEFMTPPLKGVGGLGQNEFYLDFKVESPINRVVVVPDHDSKGMLEAEIILERLHYVYGVSRTRTYEALHLNNVPEGWDDYNELPTDVTHAMRAKDILYAPSWVPVDYVRDDKNKPVINATNVSLALTKNPLLFKTLYFDEFQGSPMLRGPLLKQRDLSSYPRKFEENDLFELLEAIQRTPFFATAGKDMVQDGVMMFSLRNRADPLREHMEELAGRWDGKKRINRVFINYLGAAKTKGSLAAGRIFMLSLMARALYPGCKVDTAPVLISEQKMLKSMFCKNIAIQDSYHTDSLPNIKTNFKDAQQHLLGEQVVEVAEASSIKGAEAEAIKNFLSTASDKFRAPFARVASIHHRRCIFIITTNDDYLYKDKTGNRRFLSVKVGVEFRPTAKNMEQLLEDRDQLYAEAYYRVVNKKEQWWPTDREDEILGAINKEHLAKDSWEDELEHALRNVWNNEGVAISSLDINRFLHCERMQKYRAPANGRCFNHIMKEHGWICAKMRLLRYDHKKNENLASIPEWVWVKKGTKGTVEQEYVWLGWSGGEPTWKLRETKYHHDEADLEPENDTKKV